MTDGKAISGEFDRGCKVLAFIKTASNRSLKNDLKSDVNEPQ